MATAKIPRLIDGVCVCSICCHVVWQSTYSCDSTGSWSDPVEISEAIVAGESPGPCPSDVTWYQPGGNPCVRQYDAYYPIDDLCSDCSTAVKTPPAKPVDVPPGCCGGTCCKWVFAALYVCESETWLMTADSTTGQPCLADIPWTADGDNPCLFHRTMYVADPCGTEPDPGHPPGYPGAPTDCCEALCCKLVWSNSYSCTLPFGGWGTPTLVSSTPHVPCGVNTGWVKDSVGCGATNTQYFSSVEHGSDCPPDPVPPPNPVGPPPNCCPDTHPCTTCGTGSVPVFPPVPNPQSPVTVIGGCTPFGDGTYTPGTYQATIVGLGQVACQWTWNKNIGSFDASTFTLTYSDITGQWSLTGPFLTPGPHIVTGLNCFSGNLFGVVTTPCLGGFATFTFT